MVLADANQPGREGSEGTSAPTTGWNIQDSSELYGLERWGDPYFSINLRGHVSVQPRGERGGSLDLVELVKGLQGRNLNLPLLIRSRLQADQIRQFLLHQRQGTDCIGRVSFHQDKTCLREEVQQQGHPR